MRFKLCKIWTNYLGAALLGLGLLSCGSSVEIPQEIVALQDKLPENVDYNRHIKPILSDRCFKCHGPDKSKIEAGLQLAHYEGATMKLKSGTVAIDPGDVGGSELVRRILSDDPEEVMPMPASHLTLSDEEKALLIKWIDQGAKYQEHWSLSKIKKPGVPKVGKSVWARWGLKDDEETGWVKNEIDHFALSIMKEKGLKPSPRADKTTLLRRVYMDLTGLPPTPEELKSFMQDDSPNAYKKVVDKLLQSPHYGEQQAVSWLDLARYADSHGYQDDGLRTSHPYRDWVIKSFNENLSLDKFVTYQLAGDLLPKPTQDMMIATAFNRQHAQSEEDGIVPEEYMVEYVADRANTFGKAFLGLTMECARCHDHKYDPISQKDYYSLFAFFNNINDHGQAPHLAEASPVITLPKPEAAAKLKYIRHRLAALEKQTTRDSAALWQRFEWWRGQGTKAKLIPSDTGLVVDVPFDLVKFKQTDDDEPKTQPIFQNRANDTLPLETRGDLDVLPVRIKSPRGLGLLMKGESYVSVRETKGWWDKKGFDAARTGVFERHEPFTVSLWTGVTDPAFNGRIFSRLPSASGGFRGYECERLPDGRLAFRINSVWPDNAIDFETDFVMKPNRWTHLTMTYDGTSRAEGLKVYIDGQPATGRVVTDRLTGSIIWAKDHKYQSSGGPQNFALGRMHVFAYKDYVVDELKIFNRSLSPLEVKGLVHEQDFVKEVLRISPAKQTAAQREALFDYYITNIDPSAQSIAAHRQLLIGEETEIVTDEIDLMVSRERTTPRKSYILERGVYDAPGEEVQPETPLRLGALPENYPRNRLGLARWLLAEENPLFARVMVNRFWQQYFGVGLVKTQEDFGNQGELPSHPDLLDWLAVSYRESGWNTKALLRQMVLSATYQQSSRATKEQIEADPENRWLARGSSYRLSAEQVRDNALAASGLLVRKIGGPSVYPYQPEGIWEALATRRATHYEQQHGDSLYRRSMYTIWKRSSPPPMMLNFDSPDRSLCTVRRQKTATPLQALVTLNDPQFVEAARVLAERTMQKKPTLDARIRYFFQSALSRNPRKAELSILKELYKTEYRGFEKSPERVEAVLKAGEHERLDKSLKSAEVAALTVVANTILNYDEAIVKR
ncbi:DUF1553 domain-containing protein [Persicitalea sp.]|uniref:DUF1553 domain-containing protein n=1 Tax=Persicitalea sp. TaxID=3100273 RepID=UPI003593233C